MKDTLIERKNNLQRNNSTVDEAENQINHLEHKEEKTTNQNNKKKESKKTEESVSSFWDNFKQFKLHIIGVPEEEKEQEIGNLFEKNNERKFP